jgi:hypothetical protein
MSKWHNRKTAMILRENFATRYRCRKAPDWLQGRLSRGEGEVRTTSRGIQAGEPHRPSCSARDCDYEGRADRAIAEAQHLSGAGSKTHFRSPTFVCLFVDGSVSWVWRA